MILCEGYTDVIALHQAGIRNAVGLMGTALTGRAGGRAGADGADGAAGAGRRQRRAGGDAAAFRLASKRKLELRVVTMPAGTDPAELIQRDGAEAMQAAVKRSIRSCASARSGCWPAAIRLDPEGQDRMIEELRPVFASWRRARCAWS